MTIAPTSASRRGSALLIVLGLLSFLMISAVAFSISMRTEYAAAASYRRSVTTRELLASTFTDARATVDFVLRNQRTRHGFNRHDPSTRTVEALAPFKYTDEDVYGRLIASYNENTTDDTIAYLLDDAVMRHIPPYVASTVFNALELQTSRTGGGELDDVCIIDSAAAWKPITAQIPRDSAAESDLRGDYVDNAVIGRMAWAVVNLSDSLDINAIGSVSKYRGIGLTGNEFAFGTKASGSTAVDSSETYDLIASEDSTTTPADLPLFASNADLAQYAAQVNNSLLTIDNGEIFPYSWEDAVDREGDGYYSPFSVYSFWPNSERKKEDGTRTTESMTAPDGSTISTVVSCNEVTETAIQNSSSEISKSLVDLLTTNLPQSGSGDSIGNNFVRMLADYIDKDCVPTDFGIGNQDIYPHAAPTVERVPMISEVSYSSDGWEGSGKIVKELEKNTEVAFKGFSPDDEPTKIYTSRADIPKTLGKQEMELTIPDVAQKIGVRTYFPGSEESPETFFVEAAYIVGITAAGVVNDTTGFAIDTPDNTKEETLKGPNISGGSTDIFADTGALEMVGEGIKITIDGEKIPVFDPEGENSQEQKVTLTFLVDFLVRVKVMNGSDIVDCSPVDSETSESLCTEADYPDSAEKRINDRTMGKLDAQFFRITRPLTVTFALQWDVMEKTNADGTTGYTALSKFTTGGEPEAEMLFNEDFNFGGTPFSPATSGKESYLSASDSAGTWFTVDPRYNWMSPMMGVSGEAGAYGTGAGKFRGNFSSPHWLFLNETELTSGSTEPSDVQKDYATANPDTIPFAWGLEVQDIRYGHNDSGQLLLPAEIGFLPVPFTTNDWHPNPRNYLTNTINNYYDKVAKLSFFRTLPAVNFKDGATSEANYNDYMRLTSMLKSFAGENFPEEHRGIVHAFAGQDDYYTCQRLRQFAMLGIPSSITQAAKVTYDRLDAASQISRVSPEMTQSDLKDLKLENVTLKDPKYDTFIRDYLFYVPDNVTSEDVDSWEAGQEPYKGAGSKAAPYRVKTADDIILQSDSTDATFVDKLKAYNEDNSSDKLGQNDMTTLLAMARECFGDRQQLFLYILRADSISYNSGRDLSQHKTLATARAVALVWRDAYGELPDRVVYYQLLP